MGKIKNINNKQNQNEMKQTHLKTLSARIDELEQLRILNDLSYLEFTRLALDANKQGKEIVTLAQFVPCDENGVPLEKIKGFLISDPIHKEYNEAQKSVIFEGWEVVDDFTNNESIRTVVVTLKSKGGKQNIEFYYEDFNQLSDVCLYYFNIPSIQLPDTLSLADLAEATQLNPIKLK